MQKKYLCGCLCLVWIFMPCLVQGAQVPGVARRRRQVPCRFGYYDHWESDREWCCKKCDSGFHRQSHCSEKNENDTGCVECKAGRAFNTKLTSEKSCELCHSCDPKKGVEVKKNCTTSTDTVCRCLPRHHCNEAENKAGCTACYHCQTCEGLGEKVPCTETSDTVCNDPKGPGGTVVAVIIPLVVIALVAMSVFYLWLKKKFCFADKPVTKETNNEDKVLLQTDLAYLEDVNLIPHLPDIASRLIWSEVRDVALRNHMSQTAVDAAQRNHPNDTREQTLNLLQEFVQHQGLKNACVTLVESLRQLGRNASADTVEEIIRKGRATNP